MEMIMILVLIIMVIYFFKSTNLPKEMTNNNTPLTTERESKGHLHSTSLKTPLKKGPFHITSLNNEIDLKLTQMKYQKNLTEINNLNQDLDKLTLTITTLEQELKSNNSRNNEIQSIIDWHLANLTLLQKKISTLSSQS